jgi:hypothetical protein
VLSGVGDVLVYLDKCGDLRPSAKIIRPGQLIKMIDCFGRDRVLEWRSMPDTDPTLLAGFRRSPRDQRRSFGSRGEY